MVYYTKTSELVTQLRSVVDVLYETNQDDLADRILDVTRQIMGHTITGEVPPSNIMMDIINLLQDNGITYAVIGAIAVNVHGQSRSTEDIDFLVSEFPLVRKLRDSEYMNKFNFYKTKSFTGSHLVMDHKSGNGYVELLLANDNLRREAVHTADRKHILGVEIPVVLPEFLVALKLKAISDNPKREMKDIADITSVLIKNKNRFDVEKIKSFLTNDELQLLLKYMR